MDKEPIPRAYAELTPEEKEQVRILLTEAIHSRLRQWDAELQVEKILGQEIEVLIEGYAVCMDYDKELTDKDVEEMLGNRPVREEIDKTNT